LIFGAVAEPEKKEEHQEPEPATPQPFSITEARWDATQRNINTLYAEIQKINESLRGIK
jgi:hypothetical protein